MWARILCRSLGSGVAGLATVALAASFGVAEAQTVFDAKTPEGEVWVSIELTRFRLAEDFVPVIVAVRNNASRSVNLDRSSFELLGADRKVNPLPDVAIVLEGYRRLHFDRTAVRLVGIPIGSRLDLDRLEPSEFFPVVGSGSGLLMDEVTLAPLSWTVDTLYFRRPAGLDEGRDVTLRVKAEGWEIPVLVKFSVPQK